MLRRGPDVQVSTPSTDENYIDRGSTKGVVNSGPMTETRHQAANAADGMLPPSSKRRKIRKGTQSCWECKRRKIRCTFAAPEQDVCDGCRSRQTKCVSQEFENELSRRDRKGVVPDLGAMSGDKAPDDASRSRNASFLSPSCSSGALPTFPERPADISRTLRSLWPSPADLNLILSIPIDASLLFHGVICQPYDEIVQHNAASLSALLRLPSPESHPVLVARRLLNLAIFLQGIPARQLDKLNTLELNHQRLVRRLIDGVSRLVTNNDELLDSLDGIECVMLESMYLNNAGNLRRAWLTNRKAMTLAQMIGLHQETCTSVKVLDEETRDRINPSYMWARLVFSDRYLSLMLDLPQGSLGDVFATPDILEGCSALERMERVLAVAGNRIIQRNGTERTDIATTSNIDKLLLEAASFMPPQWWLIPNDLPDSEGGPAKSLANTVRLMNQFTYYHLMVQLHIPYLLLSSANHPCYDYSKLSATNASRETLSRYVSFRSLDTTTTYCRGIDFVVFIASMTLCLSHMICCHQQRREIGTELTCLQSLAHQRLADRGLIERTLELMDKMANGYGDAAAKRISLILRPLLAIEAKSRIGGLYEASVSPVASRPEFDGPEGKVDESGTMSIHIPYFGTIKIRHHNPLEDPEHDRERGQLVDQQSKHGLQTTNTNRQSPLASFQPTSRDYNEFSIADEPFPSLNDHVSQDFGVLDQDWAVDLESWALQGVDTALFNTLTDR
ncbi:uncharacterized protein E0L32_005328 [Thyridium curvatum]|uniref:Zn(2)-C6 fungal-type domain-containing protein n=1 Tax=Thyridium curvatum TaxID=1093900 RepID=A0A507B6B4_9PEZI|nr:uncharacterized protein E0L32_005328 [Thyridium curvatum]TPX14636.1 hypothetical protein E0L32_005328 [Thyridium curvatum]